MDHRRLIGLSMAQALRRDNAMYVRCLVQSKDDPVDQSYADTIGLSIRHVRTTVVARRKTGGIIQRTMKNLQSFLGCR